jgi:hypothetical protein
MEPHYDPLVLTSLESHGIGKMEAILQNWALPQQPGASMKALWPSGAIAARTCVSIDYVGDRYRRNLVV